MTRTRVKVCGLTDHVGFDAAVEHGADAVGLVFAPSVRRVTPAQAAALVAPLPALVTPVGVFLLPGPDEAAQTCRAAGIGLAQYDHAAGPPLPPLPPPPHGSGLAWLPVFRLGPHTTTDPLTQTKPGAVVLIEGPTSGSGATIDWAAVAALARQRRVILAGGLTPTNVAQAIRTVRPFGVDVSSGVESGPGKKDPIKIRDFLQAVRAVDMEPS